MICPFDTVRGMADFPPCDDVCGALEEHVRRFFHGRDVDTWTWPTGPILQQNPHFRALRVAPEHFSGLWTYVSTGGWAATAESGSGLEFILCTPEPAARAVELLAMTVYYHRGGRLGLGHTVPVGEPWVPGSNCEHLLVSLPYPFGPQLQACHVGDRHVEFLWLLPITADERTYKIVHGLEALESHFDQAQLKYWNIQRQSTLP